MTRSPHTEHLHRRQLLRLAGVAAIWDLALPVRAASFPSMPVKLLVGNPPGGPSDLIARIVAAELAQAW